MPEMTEGATDVDVFLADIRDHDCESMASGLGQDSLAVLARLTHPRRRAQFILGRVLLRHALQYRFGAMAATWQLNVTSGKPGLIGRGAPEISLSHSRELVACAVAGVAIGLDVEYCLERDFTALVELIGTPAELRRFLSIPGDERIPDFYRMWTLKEATFKLLGQGDARHGGGEASRHEYFQPRQGFMAALVARSAKPIRLNFRNVTLPR